MQRPNKKAKTADEAAHQPAGDETAANDDVDIASAVSVFVRPNSIENAPMDILFEVYSRARTCSFRAHKSNPRCQVFLMLHPRDLLSLARTSKACIPDEPQILAKFGRRPGIDTRTVLPSVHRP